MLERDPNAGFYRSYEERKKVSEELKQKQKNLLDSIKTIIDLPRLEKASTLKDDDPDKEKVSEVERKKQKLVENVTDTISNPEKLDN
mmetsp:Transcript_40543/g.35977  ORF Transcript_40543/g.35977 Transcript_40543/m.35977 type:complete len:87 (+) Transcript_40543:3-263(+)